MVDRPTLKTIGTKGRMSEDREILMEEVRAHCERCHDDKEEPSQVQEQRIQEQRRRGDSREAWTG